MNRWLAIPLFLIWALSGVTAYAVLSRLMGLQTAYAVLGAAIVLWLGSFVLKAIRKRIDG